jgi:hypothetical protein
MNEYIHPNGYTYTENELISSAEAENMTLQEFINNRGIKPKKPGKPKPVAKKDAVATAKSTASKSVKPSSVSQVKPWEQTTPTVAEIISPEKFNFKIAGQSKEYKKQQAALLEKQKKQTAIEQAKMEARNAKFALQKNNNEFLLQSTPSQDYMNTIDLEIKNQLNNDGKEETYIDYGRSEFSQPIERKEKINSFPEEKKEVIQDLQKSGTLSKYNEKDILDLAAEKYKKKKIASYVTNKTIDYYSNIDEETKRLKEDYLKKESNFRNLELQKKATINGDIYNHLNQSSKELNDITKRLKSYGKDPIFKTQEELDNYKELANKYNSLYKGTKDLLTTFDVNNNDIASANEKLMSIEEEYDLAKRNYGVLTNVGVRVFQGFSKLGAEIIQIANFMSPPGVRERVSEYVALSDRNNDETIEKFLGPQEEITDAKSFAKAGFNLVASQLPNWALMYASGGISTVAEKAIVTEATETIAKTAVEKIAMDAGLGAFKIAAKDNQYLKLLKLTKDKLTLPSELTAIGLSSAVGKYNEEVASNALGETNFTPLQMFSSSMLYGYSEALGEKVTLDILKSGGRTLEAAVKGDSKFVDLLKEKSMKSWFGAGFNFVGHKATDFANENISEQFSNISQNAVDKFVLGKNVNLLDNTGEVFKDTSILTAFMISAPHVAGLAIKPFLGSDSTKELKQNSTQIAKYIELMKNPELLPTEKELFKNKIKDLTAKSEIIFKNTIKDIDGMPKNTFKTILASTNELGSIVQKAKEIYNSDSTNKAESIKILESEYKQKEYALNNLVNRTKMISQLKEGLSNKDKEELFNLTNEAEDLKNEIKLLKDSPNSDAILAEKTIQLKEINTEIIDIIGEGNIKKNIQKDIERTRVAAEKLGLTEEIEIPELKTANDVIKYLEANTNLDETAIEDYSGSLGLFVPLKNGKEALIINQEEAAIQSFVTTGQHEFLHKLVYKAVKDNPELQKKIGNDLYNHIEKYIGTEEFNNTEFKERYDGYKLDFDKTKAKADGIIKKADQFLLQNLISQEQYTESVEKANNIIATAEGKYLEETLPLLSEALSKGDIIYNETFFTKLGDIIRKIFQKFGLSKVNFETGKDVFDFVRDYNKSFEKGKFTKAFGKLAKEGKYKGKVAGTKVIPTETIVKESKGISKVEDLKQNLEDLEDQYYEGIIDELEFENKKDNLEKKLKEAIAEEKLAKEKPEVVKEKPEAKVSGEEEVKEIIKSGKATISSDKVQKIYEEKGLNGADEIIKLFRPITNKIVNKRKDAPGFDEELLRDEIETGDGGIIYLIRSYKPEKGVPLAAYINKQLPLRAIAASKRVLSEQFSKDVTEEKAIMAEETVQEVKEKPKYKNALESKVLAPEELKTAENKIITILRTVKSRIDTPITLNRTVTPIIAEIKEEVGKQLDIDIKTMLGGKKDGMLRKELLRNKRYILENMTTTWLMGKDGQGGIPQAIQKQIDGRWVNYPDWVGQKIDREKTTTDQAGRTSGAELVRRLPNVFNNVSDADFLGQIIGHDGNPIRGRKESLSKAMAEEIAFDIINNDIENEGVVYDTLKTNQERLGVNELDTLANEIALQIERGNVKLSNSIIKGFEISKNKLIDNILNSETEQDEINIINNWLASDGRSIRSIAWIVKGVLSPLTTNRGLFTEIVLPIIGTYSKYKGLIGKDYYNLKDAPKGESIYFGEEKVPLWADVNLIKKDWEKYTDIIDSEALKATDNLINIINYLKEKGYSKEDAKAYFGLLGIDQRGLFRKVSKSGLGVLGLKAAQKPYLEHNAPKYDIIGEAIKYFTGDITENQLRNFIAESKVNLVPEELNNILPEYKEGSNRMYAPEVVLYLKDLMDKGHKIVGLEKEYGTKTKFNELVKSALSDISKEINIKESKVINERFNKIIGRNTGVSPAIVYSDIVAKRLGAKKGKFRFFVPPSAEDFTGLLYDFLGKGKEGEKDMEFFKRTLIDPYTQGIAAIDSAKQAIKRDFIALRKAFPDVATKLEKLTPDKDFTYDQALRVSMWSKSGIEIPGISKRDEARLNKLVESDPQLVAFRNGLMVLGQQEEGWIAPTEYWDTHTIVSDLNNMSEKGGRKKYLERFIANVESMFGKWENGKLTGPNMNKIEAIYGTNFREALENSLYAMINGTNRSYGTDKLADRWMNWVNGSTGAIMFFNTRSAILQTLGAINYLNWSDNNPLKAGQAFANQKQYWEDVAYIYNSDKMKERRAGLKEDVNAAEIANATKNAKDKVGAAMAYLLKIGYTPTQIADSFAIATGGAAFYRNRINTYKEQGLSNKQAEEKAWKDFSKVTEETQQSGDAMMVSQQQRSSIGRLVLAFGNTPMQYNRLMKKSFRDLINKRGDAKEHISKIIYYGAVQNIIFSALQNAMFALIFEDDEDEDKKRTKEEQKEFDKKKKKNEAKWIDLLNGMSDTILRGSGLAGAGLSTVKNVILEYLDQEEKGYQADHAYTVIKALGVSPAIGSKSSKLYSAIQTKKFEQDVINERGWSVMDNGRLSLSPNYKILGGLTAATTNIPLDRVVDKVNNVSEALDSKNQAWQRIALGLGWKSFDVGLKNEEYDLIKAEAKAKRKEEGVIKAKETRERTKDSIRKLPMSERIKLRKESALKRREEKIKKRSKRKMGGD